MELLLSLENALLLLGLQMKNVHITIQLKKYAMMSAHIKLLKYLLIILRGEPKEIIALINALQLIHMNMKIKTQLEKYFV